MRTFSDAPEGADRAELPDGGTATPPAAARHDAARDLSDPNAEDMLYGSESMRCFARVELGEDTVPYESTILRFRQLLERHHPTAQIFDAVKALLEEQRLLLKAGTIVDATIIGALSSTKNATQAREPERKQTRKGKQWHFGMKMHIGPDRQGLVHSLTTTDAGAADITQLPQLLHVAETTLRGDNAYDKADHKLHWEQSGGRYSVNKRARRTPYWDAINATRSRTRARVEHLFHVVKRLWGSRKCATAVWRRTPCARTLRVRWRTCT